MPRGKLVGLFAALAVVTACGETPYEPQPFDPDFAQVEDDDDDDDAYDGGIEVEGENIARFLFGNPFTSLNYSFEVEYEDGETEGWVRASGDNADGDFYEFEADITCVSVADEPPYGQVARMGAVVTGYDTNIALPADPIGAQLVWTVAPGEDGSAQSTFLFIDVGRAFFPILLDFHCGPGIPVDQFVPPGVTAPGFVSVSAEIEIEVD